MRAGDLSIRQIHLPNCSAHSANHAIFAGDQQSSYGEIQRKDSLLLNQTNQCFHRVPGLIKGHISQARIGLAALACLRSVFHE